MSEKNTKKAAPVRDLSVKQGFKISRFLVSWEMVLVYILILINLVLMISRTNLYFSQGTIQSIIQSGMDVCPLVLGMIFILMLGDIDVSVASIMIFSSMATGLCCSAGLPAFAGVIAGIAAGALCGAFNGFLIAYVGMPAVIVTIASSMLFRGIVKIILDVNVLKEFPSFYTSVAWTNILGIPIALLLFFAMASVFVFVLHKSKFGRKLYIIGNNPTCAQYSGIDVKKTKMTVFILMGVMCGIASIFFVGRMGGSVSSTMGTGYEMTAIAICVLGGVSTNGGKGKVYGPVIATLIMAFLTYTLGLLDVDANTRKIVTGLILIIAVLIPSLNRELLASLKLKFIYKGNKNVEALNIRTAEEIKVLKRNLESLKQDTSLEQAEKAAKMEKIEKNITNLQKKCKEQTDIWIKEQQEDEKRAQAFIAENSVDCIISPTTVGIAAAGQALKSSNSEIKLTGLGIPSEMQSFMPKSADEDAFDYVCPYMMLWDVIHLGAVSGAAIYAAVEGTFDGTEGSSFEMDAFRDYEATTYEAYRSGDGTAVLAGDPFVFDKSNMAEWIKQL